MKTNLVVPILSGFYPPGIGFVYETVHNQIDATKKMESFNITVPRLKPQDPAWSSKNPVGKHL